METKLTKQVAGVDITMSSGKLANLSAGSVILQTGGTVILATADIDKRESVLDYFPLGVEYIERMYASGSISGSRFMKNEGHPSADAVIKARQVDHSIRSLFPKGFKRAVSVVITVLAYDGVNDPEAMAVLGASTALTLSGAPYFGPCASVVAAVKTSGDIVINPTTDMHEGLIAEYVISGTVDKILSIEGWSIELPEDRMNDLIDEAMKAIAELNAFQMEFAKDIKKPMMEYSELPAEEALLTKVKTDKYEALKAALYRDEKMDRNAGLAEVRKELAAEFAASGETYSEMDIFKAVDYVARKILREGVLTEEKRVSGRGLHEIRPLAAEIDLLPTVHGSALFNRGLTQSLSIVTLASIGMRQMIDDMEGESTKSFMHHYNMPNYTVGEAGRYNYRPGRREIGHGMIGENALKKMIPSTEDFPYTIRVVSEIMASNGSTSMAATCASSMALMAAGVPLKRAVGGIGVGLITEDDNEDNYKLLLDIEGIEDFYGDMDFKVTGTTEGITAMQYENKLRGVKPSILKEALQLAKGGRLQVLEEMNKAISAPRTEVAPTAPRIKILSIRPERIGELIGPGGKNIRKIIEEAGGERETQIDIDDNGRIVITGKPGKFFDRAIELVEAFTIEPEIGKIYDGEIDKVMEFGAFVNVSASITGLIHVSEMSQDFVKDPNTIVKSGQKVRVKLFKMENGRQSFTMKGIEQPK
jgi:polyribonucleotide nucleotidyltransferase